MTTATTAPSSPGLRVSKGKREAPLRVMVMGTEGVGKSTFAAGAPGVIFLDPEDGSGHLDVPRLVFDGHGRVRPRTLAETMDALRQLYNEEHEYCTVAIDTADALEGMLWEDLCTRNKWQSIEQPGYGKGYVAALEDWRKLLHALDVLREQRGMNVVIVAHAVIKTFSNPQGEDYMRYEPKLHKGAAAILKEWSDCVMFAEHETHATKERKAISTGRRILHTERDAAFDAKNRLGLPPVIDLSWTAFETARKESESNG